MSMVRRELGLDFHPSAILRQKLAKRHSQYYCRIDPSLFTGVFFALLIIFMLIPGPSSPHHRLPIDLASSAHSRPMPWAMRDDALRLVIARDGKVYFGNEKVALDQLPTEIRNRIQDGAEKRVYLLTDARARYSEVKPVLDEVGLAGVEDVSFLTDSRPRQ
ncbi:MAG: biopolymer transporter ExbD [Candidatus Acidiferrales bacterium]